jgi:RNA polymerase sigma factor (sigma-70 family)
MSGNQDDLYDEGSLESLVELVKAGHPAVLAALLERIQAGDSSALAVLVERAKTRDAVTLAVLVKRARTRDPAALAALIERAKTNARGAFDILAGRYYIHIKIYIRSLVHDESAVEDLTQDTFLKAWMGLPSLKKSSSFGSWLRQIAKNLVTDHQRKSPKTLPIPLEQEGQWIDVGGEAADPATVVPAREYKKEIMRRVFKDFLQQGKRKHLECFRLRTFTNKSDEEIGKMLGIGPISVGVYCSQVRAALCKERDLENWITMEKGEESNGRDFMR